MERIYHPYWKWEDFKDGFYNNISGSLKKDLTEKVLEMFNDEQETKRCMNLVINKWVYSCEHNLTNPAMNKIAYIGQGACCLYAGVPSTITMSAWSLLDLEVRNRADLIAKEVLEKWINKNNNKQLCLNLD